MNALAALGVSYAAWKWADNSLHLSHDIQQARVTKKLYDSILNGPQDFLVPDQWETVWKQFSSKECIIFEDTSYTYLDVEQASNRVARHGLEKGVKAGHVVALIMENRPDFFATWLGLSKIGAAVALINTNIRGRPLVHSIQVANSQHVYVGKELINEIEAVNDQLRLPLHIIGPGAFLPFTATGPYCPDPVDRSVRSTVKKTHPWGFIYTSGTTGLPKACVITHTRYLLSWCLPYAFGVRETDRVYTVLPLYHSAGGMLGLSCVLRGATLVLRKKFSAKWFFPDCIRHDVTVIQYIGELCRYLLQVPKSGYDQAHKIRVAFGNGLRPEIWGEFQSRFGIKEIGEFYGSTEGNVVLANHCTSEFQRGACGRLGWLGRKALGVIIARFDIESESLVRGADGFCVECKPGEVGELLGKISEDKPFSGYSDPQSTKKKIVENVFKEGDKYFRTGDLLKRDTNGFFYFMDRVGDTFRWKGENVSTTEVSEVLSVFEGVIEANIYGVQIPNTDGRACMAALVVSKPLDINEFSQYVVKNLPSFSVPLFVRFLPEMDITGTFKHRKVDLQKDGFDPSKSPLTWAFNEKKGLYDVLTQERYHIIMNPPVKAKL